VGKLDGDGCGCFPSGKHYAGISHLLKATVRGLTEGFSADAPWQELPIALLDVETTGRDAQVDRVVELGIVIGKQGEIVARHNWLINPEGPIAKEAQAIHGISDEDVKDAPTFKQLAAEIAAALQGTIIGAYNASFDRGFVGAEFARAKFDLASIVGFKSDSDWFDPLIWARFLYANERSRTLGDMAARLNIKLENAHRASDDAEAALRVLWAMAGDARVPKSLGAFVSEQRRLAQAQQDARRMWSR
jgi:DNA polymerase III subunit epsilon